MFVNDYLHTLDGKFRLMLPAKYQTELAPGLFLTKGLGRSLRVFTREEFEKRSKRILELPTMDPETQALRRFWFSSAVELLPDGQGRIVLPEKLRQHIGVAPGDTIALVGSYDYVELLSAEEWKKESEQVDQMIARDGGAVWAKYGI